jgi:hypothetical protein
MREYADCVFFVLREAISHARGFWRKDGPSLIMSLSEKRLYKKGFTALRVSGPPRLRSMTPFRTHLAISLFSAQLMDGVHESFCTVHRGFGHYPVSQIEYVSPRRRRFIQDFLRGLTNFSGRHEQ